MIVVITSRSEYIDIDAYASCIGYRELLACFNIESKAVTTSLLNQSISWMIKDIPLKFDDYFPGAGDRFIVLDVSDPTHFDRIVLNHDYISEVIDHHTGHEEYWAGKKEVRSQIEPIGSIATIIYEKFIQSQKEEHLTSDLCKLLVAAIVDNTLNLKASITNERDIVAFNQLCKIGNIDYTWVQEYLESCEENILNDLENAIKNDTKAIEVGALPCTFGQLVVFNHEKVLDNKKVIEDLYGVGNDWVVNIISLKSGKSYLMATSGQSKRKLEKLFGKKFSDDVMVLDKFMLRKEIIAKAVGK